VSARSCATAPQFRIDAVNLRVQKDAAQWQSGGGLLRVILTSTALATQVSP
jgi:hypothetical protein